MRYYNRHTPLLAHPNFDEPLIDPTSSIETALGPCYTHGSNYPHRITRYRISAAHGTLEPLSTTPPLNHSTAKRPRFSGSWVLRTVIKVPIANSQPNIRVLVQPCQKSRIMKHLESATIRRWSVFTCCMRHAQLRQISILLLLLLCLPHCHGEVIDTHNSYEDYLESKTKNHHLRATHSSTRIRMDLGMSDPFEDQISKEEAHGAFSSTLELSDLIETSYDIRDQSSGDLEDSNELLSTYDRRLRKNGNRNADLYWCK